MRRIGLLAVVLIGVLADLDIRAECERAGEPKRRNVDTQCCQIEGQSRPAAQGPDCQDRSSWQQRREEHHRGTDASGGRVAYGYTVMYDGKDHPITGTGRPNGAETIATKRVDASTFESTLKRAGKIVLDDTHGLLNGREVEDHYVQRYERAGPSDEQRDRLRAAVDFSEGREPCQWRRRMRSRGSWTVQQRLHPTAAE